MSIGWEREANEVLIVAQEMTEGVESATSKRPISEVGAVEFGMADGNLVREAMTMQNIRCL